MKLIPFLKNVFSIPMLLVYGFFYYFRYQLLILILELYVSHFSLGQAFLQRMIGEYYFSQSHLYAKNAKPYFQQSMAYYLDELNKTQNRSDKATFALSIGTQYECGKGVNINLKEAKAWYERALAYGMTDATQAITRINTALVAADGSKEQMNPAACVPPDVR